MKVVSMLKFRREAETVLRQVRKGQAFLLTYRGRPVARLEPVKERQASEDDPIYRISDLASRTAQPMTNEEIDRIVYGE